MKRNATERGNQDWQDQRVARDIEQTNNFTRFANGEISSCYLLDSWDLRKLDQLSNIGTRFYAAWITEQSEGVLRIFRGQFVRQFESMQFSIESMNSSAKGGDLGSRGKLDHYQAALDGLSSKYSYLKLWPLVKEMSQVLKWFRENTPGRLEQTFGGSAVF